jgi:hypothetical protein
MNEDVLKEEVRLFAIEYMIMNLYTMFHRLVQSSPEQILKAHEEAREMLATQTFPGSDPAESDLVAQEVQAAVERMLDGIEEMTGLSQRKSR